MRKIRLPLIDMARMLSIATVGTVLLFGLLSFRVGKLHSGISSQEAPTVQMVQNHTLGAKQLLQENSLFLPYKIGIYILEKVHLTSIANIRMVGALIGVLGALGFYFVIREWHTRRIAFMTTFLFATSSGFLHASRLASPVSMYVLLPWLIYFGIRIQENNLRLIGLGTICIGTLLLLYVPGLVWFIIPAMIWQRKRVKQELQQAGKARGMVLLIGSLLLLLPLCLSLLSHPSLIKSWVGWTSNGLTPLEFLKNLVGIPIQLMARSDLQPMSHVGHLPYLDIATTVLLALGAYWYFFLRRLDRTKLLLGGLIGGAVLAAIDIQMLPILYPFIYLIVGGGITLLLQQWFTVFPRNPLARNIGVGLIAGLILLVGYYQMHRYFVAWPRTPETKQAYSTRI